MGDLLEEGSGFLGSRLKGQAQKPVSWLLAPGSWLITVNHRSNKEEVKGIWTNGGKIKAQGSKVKAER